MGCTTHGGNVAYVDGKGLPAKGFRGKGLVSEVNSFDQSICCYKETPVPSCIQDCAIIPDSLSHIRWKPERTFALDQLNDPGFAKVIQGIAACGGLQQIFLKEK